MVKNGFDITEDKIRSRQRDPEDFKKDTFRTIRLTSGVKAIVAIPKDSENGDTEIQSILFDKERFDEREARQWLKRNRSRFSDAVTLENEKSSLFTMSMHDELEIMKERISEMEKESSEPTGLDEIKEILMGLNERIEKLETSGNSSMSYSNDSNKEYNNKYFRYI